VNQSDPKKDIYGTYDKIRFYGYDNTDVDRQTSMKITYKVDGAVSITKSISSLALPIVTDNL